MRRKVNLRLRRTLEMAVVGILLLQGAVNAEDFAIPIEVQGDYAASEFGGTGTPNPAGMVDAEGNCYLKGAEGQSDFIDVVAQPRAYFAFLHPDVVAGKSFVLLIDGALADFLEPARVERNSYEGDRGMCCFFDYNAPGSPEDGRGVPLRPGDVDRWVTWRIDAIGAETGPTVPGPEARALVDTRVPASAASIAGEPRATNAPSVEVGFSAADPVAEGGTHASGVAHVELLVKHERGDWTQSGHGEQGSSTGTVTYVFTEGDGQYYFGTVVSDKAGNREELPSGNGDDRIIYDTTAPSSQAECDDYNSTGTIVLSWSATDDLPEGVSHSGIKSAALWVRYEDGAWAESGLAPQEAEMGTFLFSPGAEGRYYFAARGSDDAGNLETVPTGTGDDSTIYDKTPPLSECGSPQYDNTGSVPVDWTASDDLPTGVTHSGIGSVALWVKYETGAWADSGLATQEGASGIFNYPLLQGEGTYYFKTRATDRAGNTGPLREPASTTYDITPPIFENAAVTPSTAKAGDIVTITFTVSEELREDPSVKVGNNLATKAARSGNDYTFVYQVAGEPTDIEGENVVEISGFDMAGNRGFEQSAVYFNFTPPAFENISVSPDPARAGVMLTISFSATEQLRENPTVIVGSYTATFATRSGNDYTYTYAVQGVEPEGDNVITIRGVDLVGNSHEDASVSVVFDFTPPAFSDIDVSPNPATLGDGLTISFDASETLLENPNVTVSGFSATFTSESGNAYTYAYLVQGVEPPGDNVISISGMDLAGNYGEDDSATVTLLFASAPSITYVKEPDWQTCIPDGGSTSFDQVIVKGEREPDCEVYVFDIVGLENPHDPAAPCYGSDVQMGTDKFAIPTAPALAPGIHVFVARAKCGTQWSLNSNTWTVVVLSSSKQGQGAPVPVSSGFALGCCALILAALATVAAKGRSSR